MIKHLTKHGNSYALIIDRSIMDLLQVREKTPLYVTTDGDCLLISPVRGKAGDRKFHEATSWALRRYRKDLKRLAE